MNFVNFYLSQHFFYILIFLLSCDLFLIKNPQNPYKIYYFLNEQDEIFEMHINCFNRFRFLAEVSTSLQKCTIFGNSRSITQKRKKETRQMTLFSFPFWALTVIFIFVFKNCKNLFSCGQHFGPFWSAKYLIFVGENCNNRILSSLIQETCTFRKVKKTHSGT